jgi:hypothetical protein
MIPSDILFPLLTDLIKVIKTQPVLSKHNDDPVCVFMILSKVNFLVNYKTKGCQVKFKGPNFLNLKLKKKGGDF